MENVLEGLLLILPQFEGTTVKDLTKPNPAFTRKLLWSIIYFFATELGLTPNSECPNDIQLVGHANKLFRYAEIMVHSALFQISIFDVIAPTKKTTMALFHMGNLLLSIDTNLSKLKDPITKVKNAKISLEKHKEEIEEYQNSTNEIMVNNAKLSVAIPTIEHKIFNYLKLNEDTEKDSNAFLKLKTDTIRKQSEIEYLKEKILKKKSFLVDNDEYDRLKNEVDCIKTRITERKESMQSAESVKDIDNELLGQFQKIKILLLDIEHVQREAITAYNQYEPEHKITEEKLRNLQALKADIETECKSMSPIVFEINSLQEKIFEAKQQFDLEKTNLENEIHKVKVDIEENIILKKNTLNLNESKENYIESIVKEIRVHESEGLVIKNEFKNTYKKILDTVAHAHEIIASKQKSLILQINQ